MGFFVRIYMRVCKKMVIYLGIKTPQSRKERKYTWQKNTRTSCSRNDRKYTSEKTARISCHNFETDGRPYRIKWSPDTILSCSFFRIFFPSYIFRRAISPSWLLRQQYLIRYRNFHHFLALWWARNNFGVIFSFVYTVSALFTFHILVAHGGPSGYIQNFIFASVFQNSQS